MRTLPQILGGYPRRFDHVKGADGRHDFDLVVDHRQIAVEVTTYVEPEIAKFEAALIPHSIHHGAPDLEWSWEIRVEESVRLEGLMDRIRPLLVRLETLGVTGLGSPGRYDAQPMVRYAGRSPDRRVPAEVRDLMTLGVDTAWADIAGSDTTVEFLRKSTHASGGSEYLVTAAVEQVSQRKVGVLSRPLALDRDERHLFVWFHADLGGMRDFSLWSGQPEWAPTPILPCTIDHCWAAAWSSTPGEGLGHVVIWEASRGGGWQYPASLSVH
jgi:hypothetical protein